MTAQDSSADDNPRVGRDTRAVANQVLLCCALAAATLFVYRGSLEHGFVTMDDYPYIVENENLHGGLDRGSFEWSVATLLEPTGFVPFPLTWLSFALDVELTGLDPRGFHRTNILLHAINAVLLYLALAMLTRSPWRSYLVACVFALHPLHVESVAWITERKDVLSGLFFMLTLLAWANYARSPSLVRYLFVAVAMTLGLLAKSSLVTLPCVLLLLDFWPLARFDGGGGEGRSSWQMQSRAVFEKLPLFLLAAVASYATYSAGASADAIVGASEHSLFDRVANALTSYVEYLRDTIWPTDLAPFYPHPQGSLPLAQIAVAGVVLLGSSVFAIVKLRTAPHVAVGWFWFLGMLVPMIGLIQAGPQARADRFMYLPQIGLCVAVLWSVPDRWVAHRTARRGIAILAAAILLGLAGATQRLLPIWESGITLFEFALGVTHDNAFARHGLGMAYWRAGQDDKAIPELRAAVELAPRWTPPMVALGALLSKSGETRKAMKLYERAIKLAPDHVEVRAFLAELLMQRDEAKRAIPHLIEMLEHEKYSGTAQAHALLGLAHAKTGNDVAARNQYQAALALRPDYTDVHANLGLLLAMRGSERELARTHLERAVELGVEDAGVLVALSNLYFASHSERAGLAKLREAVALDPGRLDAVNNLAWYLVTVSDPSLRDPAQALGLARRAAVLSKRTDHDVLETLAVALEANDLSARAAGVLTEAIELARMRGDSDAVRRMNERRGAGLLQEPVP